MMNIRRFACRRHAHGRGKGKKGNRQTPGRVGGFKVGQLRCEPNWRRGSGTVAEL